MTIQRVLNVVLFLGTAVLLLGAVTLVARYMELRSWSRAEGVVVKYRKGVRGHPPYVAYEVDGREFVVGSEVHRSGLAATGLKRGDKVRVYYPAENPAAGRLDLFLDLWFVPTVLTGNGAFLVVISQILSLGRSMVFQRSASGRDTGQPPIGEGR